MLTALLLTLCLSTPSASAQEGPPPTYGRVVELVRDLYLELDQVEPADLLDAAAERLSDEIDWLGVRADGPVVQLLDGDGRPIGEVTVTGWDDLPAALYALEVAVRATGRDLGELDLRHTTLDGATHALDRFSRVLVGDGLDRFDTRLKGTLVGIGARLSIVDDRLRITGTFADGPAEKAGVLAGDWVERIDGRGTTNMPVSEAVRLIRGEPGTAVAVDLVRETTADDGTVTRKPMHLELERDNVIVPNVEPRVLDGGVGYVRIDHVSQKTVYNLRHAMAELLAQDALGRGLVIDLRGNTGGSMKESAGVVDQFVRSGLLLTTAGRDGNPVQNLMARMDARDAGDEPPIPIVVLVDRRTASGAEIIAGALLEHERVVLLGQRTYGKGKVQKIYDLDDDASLKLTVAQYILLHDRRVNGEGIVPDVTLGDVVLRASGVRFDDGWDLERERVDWDDVVPVVDEREDWRGTDRDPGDVELEIAREAILRAAAPTRQAVLAAVDDVVRERRATEEAWLADALEDRGIDWSPATGPGAPPEVATRVWVSRDTTDPDVHTIYAEVANHGPTMLHRALVRLHCTSFGYWDDLVIPIGAVPSGATRAGKVTLELAPGIAPREDLVAVEVRSDRRPPVTAPEVVLAAGSTPEPRVAIDARLTGQGAERTAHITVHNKSGVTLTGLEAEFAYPNDLPVDLVDHASRRPELAPDDSVTFDLAVKLGQGVPASLPMRLKLDASHFGRLLTWEIPLHVDGSPTHVEAPDIVLTLDHLSADPGTVSVPLSITDDGAITSVTVFLNGDKVLYDPGGAPHVDLVADLPVVTGANRLVVRAVDDHHIVQVRQYSVLGLGDPGEGVASKQDDGDDEAPADDE
ncbi:MAG: hypothetical protein H6733_15005 [Alphaproteobacteria bacterium]|nr:hypothetical protein [Alphaproteobacteria bacterium]